MNEKTKFRIGSIAIVAMLVIVGVIYATVPAMGEVDSIPVIEWDEDETLTFDLDAVLPIGWHNFSIEGNTHIGYTLDENILSLIPDENWYGSEEVTISYYIPVDSPIIFSSSNSQHISVDVLMRVDPVNDPPEVSQTSIDIEFNEDGRYTLDLNSYFSDVDSDPTFSAKPGDSLSISIDNGLLEIIPAPDWHGNSEIEVFATDGEFTASMTVHCTVDAVPEYPVDGDAISVAMLEDGEADIDLTDYIPPNWDSIEIYSDNPSISWNLNGVWLHIVPATDWNGECDISVHVEYSSWGDPEPPVIMSETDFTFYIDIDVAAVNDPPVAHISRNMAFSMSENTVQTIDLNPLFSDPDGDALIFSAYSSADELNVDVNAEGILTLQPTYGWYGRSEIYIIAFDGLESASIAVDCSVIYSPEIVMEEDVPASIDLSQYLSPNTLNVSANLLEGDAALSLDTDSGTLDIRPAENWNGEVLIELSGYYWCGPVAFDEGQISPDYVSYMVPFSEQIEVTVEAVNDPPSIVMSAPSLEFPEDSSSEISDISEYFEDVDSNLSFTVVGGSHVSAHMNGDLVDITPEKDWFGSDEIYIIASDGEYSVRLAVPVNIEAVDDPPVMLPGFDEVFFNEDSTGTIDLDALFSDIDSSLEYSVSGPEAFSYDIENGMLLIKPASNWFGASAITIVASDGTFNVSKEIEVHVLPVDDLPIAKTGRYSITGSEDGSLVIDLKTLFSDIDSKLTFTYSGGDNLIISIDSEGKATLIPASDWYGYTTVYFIASDGEYSTSIPVDVRIESVNDAPALTKTAPVIEADRGNSYTIDLSMYFSDPDGDSLTYTASAGDGIEVSIDGSLATIVVTDDAGADSVVSFTASDGKASSSMEMHVVSLPTSVESQSPPPELPDMSDSSSSLGTHSVATYSAAVLMVAMAAIIAVYVFKYMRPVRS